MMVLRVKSRFQAKRPKLPLVTSRSSLLWLALLFTSSPIDDLFFRQQHQHQIHQHNQDNQDNLTTHT